MKNVIIRHVLIIAAVILICALCGGCPIFYITGIPCPACGITRACLCVLKGDIAGAFVNHPLFWLLPILLLYAIHSGVLPEILRKKWLQIAVTGASVLVFGVWIFRLTTGDPVIHANFNNGIIALLIDKLLQHSYN